MSTQHIRLFLLAALLFTSMLLWNKWQDFQNLQAQQKATATTLRAQEARQEDKDIPALPEKNTTEIDHQATGLSQTSKEKTSELESEKVEAEKAIAARQIMVKTDVIHAQIDTLGGDIIYLDLPAYPEGEAKGKNQPFVLFDQNLKRYYIAQSGLTGEDGPDQRGVGRAQYTASQKVYELAEGQDRLVVDLKTKTKGNVDITKRFIFQRGHYQVDVEYLIDNAGNKPYQGSLYGRLKRKPEQSTSSAFLGIQTYTGAALHTPKTPYKKISFKDIAEKPFTEEIPDGFAAMVEHYFVSAWIPATGLTYTYQTAELEDGSAMVGFVGPKVTVLPGNQDSIEAKLYAGPQITEVLEKLSPGLDMSVDYGLLWPICKPIFWLLKEIYQVVGNWGWAIVIITIIIKLLFYKLSASSYRSMGNMRKLQPRIEALKARYGEDRQKFSQAVMELYKKEKVNPLGGCLPVLIQIPVFIALYYVLLGSVELRQAPFILWIHDLSVKDPYYVLPILMGLSMFVQQKLNPPPPDPVQAKVMMAMPLIFTVLFLNFPAGLVLYWFVNNVLSIAQQWVITRRIVRVPHGAS